MNSATLGLAKGRDSGAKDIDPRMQQVSFHATQAGRLNFNLKPAAVDRHDLPRLAPTDHANALHCNCARPLLARGNETLPVDLAWFYCTALERRENMQQWRMAKARRSRKKAAMAIRSTFQLDRLLAERSILHFPNLMHVSEGILQTLAKLPTGN